jgi:NADH-quinone oxidoreductase chain G
MIKLTIDGIEVELEKPVTVLEAAKKAGIKIPTLCYFEGLPPFGGCRLCLVEVEKLPKLQTACTIMAADGMVVRTETQEIKAARRAMLEFLLINHPLDCPYCDKAGECELQDLVAKYGPEAGRFAEGKRRHPESFDDPIIVRNMERCVLCTRCIRMCEDLQGAYAISVTGRGAHSFVEPFSGGRYDCEYCGNCLTVCPVGAIMSRLHRHSYRPWFVQKESESICGYCGVGCRMVIQTRENSIIRTIPRLGLGLNKGLLCVRGRFGYDYIESPERLTTAYIRKDGELKPASIEEALEFVARRLKEIKDSHGADSIGAVASGRCTNEDNYMLQRLFRFVIGTNNIDSLARLYYVPTIQYLERIFGQGITANLIPGIANSDGVFVAGGDPTKINPILGLQIRTCHRNGGKIIVLGPAGGLKRFVSYETIPSPLSEETILSAIVVGLSRSKELSGENKYIEEKIKATKEPSDEELAAAGSEKSRINRLVEDLSTLSNPVVVIGPELLQSPRPSKVLFLMGAIAYMIGARIFVLSDRPNYQGLMDMGCLPDTLPGARPLEFETFRHKVENAMGRKVPEQKGMNLLEMLQAAKEGRIKALYVMGENLAYHLPESEDSLKALDLLVVQELYMTETARLADVVLPAAGWSEKEGTFTNLERRLQRLEGAKVSLAGLEDWRILSKLMARMGEEKIFDDIRHIWEEIVNVSPLHGGINIDEIGPDGFMYPYHGEPLRGVEGEFDVEALDEVARPSETEKFILLMDRPLYHSGTQSRRSKALRSIKEEPVVLINPEDSQQKGLKDSDMVKLVSEKDSLTVRLHVSEDVISGTLRLCNTFSEVSFSRLVNYRVDPVTTAVVFTENRVRLEKA